MSYERPAASDAGASWFGLATYLRPSADGADAEFSGDPSATYPIKVWSGVEWQICPLKRWNGETWVTCVLKRWDGAAWVAV